MECLACKHHLAAGGRAHGKLMELPRATGAQSKDCRETKHNHSTQKKPPPLGQRAVERQDGMWDGGQICSVLFFFQGREKNKLGKQWKD